MFFFCSVIYLFFFFCDVTLKCTFLSSVSSADVASSRWSSVLDWLEAAGTGLSEELWFKMFNLTLSLSLPPSPSLWSFWHLSQNLAAAASALRKCAPDNNREKQRWPLPGLLYYNGAACWRSIRNGWSDKIAVQFHACTWRVSSSPYLYSNEIHSAENISVTL